MNIDKYLLESEINNMNNDRMKRVRPTTQSLMNKLPIHPGEKLPANEHELRMRCWPLSCLSVFYWDSREIKCGMPFKFILGNTL